MSIKLTFDRIRGERSGQSIVFLHGILGRGNNLRSIARRFVDSQPDWTAWLVDLRGHGQSPKGTAGASLEAAARDVVSLAGRVELGGTDGADDRA
jgi:pimeloyl-ACP methyl ester carboxylesterase